jgi:GNAT superfamily N-acetyltransferase
MVVAGPEQWDVVERLVLTLLHELGDEAEDTGALRPELRGLWESRPDRMVALIAYAEEGGIEPIGLLTLVESFAIYANGPFGIIPEMYVAPQWRSKGVGKALIDRAVEFGRQRGWSRIDVTGPESAEPRTIRFYESCGFEFAGPKLKLMLKK